MIRTNPPLPQTVLWMAINAPSPELSTNRAVEKSISTVSCWGWSVVRTWSRNAAALVAFNSMTPVIIKTLPLDVRFIIR